MTYAKSGTGAEQILYIMHPEGLVAKESSAWVYKYFKTDHLGSTHALLAARGTSLTKEQSTDFYPFGLAHSTNNLHLNRYLFSGNEIQDVSLNGAILGLYDFHARYYNPMLGRWFNIDPALQMANPYLYCANNPICYVDPDGEFFWLFAAAAFIFFTEPGYELQKAISPVAVKFDLHLSGQQSGFGVNVSVGVPKALPVSYRFHAGATYYWKYYDNSFKGWETRYGGEWSVGLPYLRLTYEGTTFNSGGISQTTNRITLGTPFYNVQYENDYIIDRDKFNIWGVPQSKGYHDRYRTAAVRINVWPFGIGLNMMTGDPGPSYYPDEKGFTQGWYDSKGNYYDPDKYRAGALYFKVGPFRFGGNSEGIRNTFQNQFAHIWLMGTFGGYTVPKFNILPRKPKGYFYFGFGSGGTLW